MLRIAQFINLFLLTLVSGVFWGTWFSLSRSIESITPQTFLEVGKSMMANLGGPMSILFPLAILSTLPVLYGMYREHQKRDLLLVSSGLVLFIVALAGTLMVNVPIDRQINDWTINTLPPDWPQIRDRWEFWHAVRTFASLAGIACVIAGVMHVPDSGLATSDDTLQTERTSGSSSTYAQASARQR
jgi:uncharacterized membrane protein